MIDTDSHRSLPVAALTVLLLFQSIEVTGQESDFRSFTSSDGKKIEAKVISSSGENITIKMKNGREFNLPVSRFSQADQEWITAWKNTEAESYIPELSISFDENLEKSNDETGFAHIEKFSPEVTITNEEESFDLTDAQATTLIIVEDVEKKDSFHVLSKETVSFSLPAGKTKTMEGKKSETVYATLKAYGARFTGYAVIIENASGKIIASEGSKRWGTNPENALKANEGSTVPEYFSDEP